MNMKDYEKQAEELTKQAQKLEATMLTLKALESCVRTGHDFEMYPNGDDQKTWTAIGEVHVQCSTCGCETILKGADLFYRKENEEGWGDLAGKKLKDIEIETPDPSPETTETDEKPSVPVESELDDSGVYRVDVEKIMRERMQND